MTLRDAHGFPQLQSLLQASASGHLRFMFRPFITASSHDIINAAGRRLPLALNPHLLYSIREIHVPTGVLSMCRRLIALFCVLTSLHVEAGYDTGNRLFEDCNSDNYFNRGYCGGYVVGVVDTMEAMQASGLVPKNALCIPGGATKGQLADTVRQYLADHPERRHRDSGSLVPEALKAAFPCGK